MAVLVEGEREVDCSRGLFSEVGDIDGCFCTWEKDSGCLQTLNMGKRCSL